MKIEIQLVAKEDLVIFRELISIFESVFEMKSFSMPAGDHLQKLLSKKDFFAVIAKNNDKVIGGLTAYVLHQYYSTQPQAYIYDLAVSVAFQRKGIGMQLINFTKEHCRLQGFEAIFVQAEKADDHAINFYRKTFPTKEEDVIHFNYSLD